MEVSHLVVRPFWRSIPRRVSRPSEIPSISPKLRTKILIVKTNIVGAGEMQDTVPHTRRKVARARPTATAVCQSPCSWGNIFTGLLRGDRIIGPRHRHVRRLPRFPQMCYNLPAVQPITKQVPTYDAFQPDHSMPSSNASAPAAASYEHASHFCPVCSQRLESRRCKLICVVCGYYMSCADYY